MRTQATGILLWATIAIATPQSFNIDTNMNTDPELGGGPPSSAFGAAAGQAGFWETVPTGNNGPFVLRGLDGLPTGVTLSAVGWGGGGAWNNPVNSGDYKLLLNDADRIAPGFEYTISGLVPGPYRVYTYCIKPNGQFGEAFITVPGAIVPTKHASGIMPGNQLIEGVTHTVHDVTVVNGSLRIQAAGPWPNAYLNGLQISAVPEPMSISAMLTGIGLYWGRRRWRS